MCGLRKGSCKGKGRGKERKGSRTARFAKTLVSFPNVHDCISPENRTNKNSVKR